ncbi:MAG TPA: hypothetical protein VFN10_14580 [Thermoanaerobaculia bacterium]|nr:hypothetical protein [Thermoanaerobaculia bacterium]
MRIAQVILPGASAYERKSQRIDHAALAALHDVQVVPLEEVRSVRADLAHVYAPRELRPADFAGFPLPYVSSAPLPQTRWSWRRPVAPRMVVDPFTLPEAVEEHFFEGSKWQPHERETKIIGSFDRPAVRDMIQRTLARVERFRSDVVWHLFEEPTPDNLLSVDIWADPAMDDLDYDGYVSEALVVGAPVVAARTPLNDLRLEKNRTGFLVPRNDPNEMTHAILTALFKQEVAEQKLVAARQTVSKFRPRHRLRVLKTVYDNVKP